MGVPLLCRCNGQEVVNEPAKANEPHKCMQLEAKMIETHGEHLLSVYQNHLIDTMVRSCREGRVFDICKEMADGLIAKAASEIGGMNDEVKAQIEGTSKK